MISEGEPLGEIIDTLILLENYGIETDRIFTVNVSVDTLRMKIQG